MYQCRPPLDRLSSIVPATAQPARTNHPMKTRLPRCSQSALARRTFPDPTPAPLLRSKPRPVPGLLRGCVRETIRDAAPEIPRPTSAPAVTHRETLPPTCYEIPASHWPDSPDSWCEWPWEPDHTSREGGASPRTVPPSGSMAATAWDWRKISEKY